MRWNLAVLGGMLAVCSGAGCQLVIGIGDWVEASGGAGGGTAGGGAGGTGGVTTGGTGGTGGTSCTPGEKVACYTGPAGTEGVGTCKGGTATCNDQGTGYGGCEGQVVPGPEVPDAIGDEACDGYTPGEPVWWRTFGSTGNEVLEEMLVDSDGSIFICGDFDGTLALGDNTPLNSQGMNDIFLAKLAPDGKPLWSRGFGEAQDQTGCHLALDRAGGVYLAGTWPGQFSFGGMLYTGGNVRVARFDAGGDHVWSGEIGAPWPAQTVRALASAGNGNLVAVGAFTGKIQVGSSAVDSTTGTDVYLAQYSRDSGARVWGLTWPDTQTAADGDDTPLALSVSADDQISVLAKISHGVWVDAPQGQTIIEAMYKHPFVVVQYSNAGLTGWTRLFEYEQSDNFDEPVSLLSSNSGGFLLAVQHSGLNPGGVAVSTLAALDGAGAPFLELNIDTPIPDIRLASNKADDVLVGLRVQGITSFAGTVLGPAAGGGGIANAIVGTGHADPSKDWSRSMAEQLLATDSQGVPRVGAAMDGGLVTAVSFEKTIVFGGKAITSAGGGDVAVARFAP